MTEQAKVPAIRFAGFTDPWEQRKLGELGFAQSGIGFPDAEQGGAEGTPFFKVSDMNTPGNEYELAASKNYVTAEQIARMGWHPLNQVPAIFFAKVGAAVMLNRKRLVNEPFLLDNNTMAFSMDSSLLDTQFGQSLFERLDLTSLIQVGALPSFNSSDVESISVSLPSTMDEQRQIGQYLCNLNTLITLHQRKYDKLVVFKKSMLEKMFPKDGESVPEIRFAGFTDPWEQRKLGEIATRVTRKNEGESDLPLTISAQHGLVDQRTFFNNQVASKDMSGYYLLRKGEFAYNKSTSGDSPWGAVKRLVNYEKGCVSTLYICFGLDGTDPNYLVTYYETDCWHKGVQMIAAEGARNHGLLNIAPNDFFDTVLALPSSQEEQRRVGSLFARLDSLITLHQRKLELLRNIKKSLLDKMFV